MKVSEKWLKEYVDKELSTEELSQLLTMAGLEVDSIESCNVEFTNVVIAKVTSCESISGADKLSICEVDDGSGESKRVVCGADNVQSGRFYPYARIGAKLSTGLKIEKRTIRGIASEGMLCSGSDLGLSDTSTGLYELDDNGAPGDDLHTCLSLDDYIFDISLTPNRGDCLSVIGLARELSVLANANLKKQVFDYIKPEIKDALDIKLDSPDLCPRYCGQVIRDVDSSVISPIWLKERLRRSGVRSINVIVDLTNYVMLEMGQPMHAFDIHKLHGNICVRQAKQKEQITLLDGESYSLDKNTLVISDDSGAIAMAGIMGGESTSVSTDTTAVFLESAYFTPIAIMGRARQYGLHTDASHRFERGVDPELAEDALCRLATLILEYCGGKVGPVVHSQSQKDLPNRRPVLLRTSRINQILGTQIDDSQVSAILLKLGFSTKNNKNGWSVSVPSYRFDIEQEVDLIEEIARIHGYQQITETLPDISMNLMKTHARQHQLSLLINCLVSMGYNEVITYSFVDREFQAMLGNTGDSLELLNPISADMSVMRNSLLAGLLKTLQFNVKRQQTRLRIFETGRCFYSDNGGISEKTMISGLIYGNIYKKQWGISNISCDFYYIKSDIEAVLCQFLETDALSYKNSMLKSLHPYQNAEIYYNNQTIGYIGTVNPKVQTYLDLPESIQVFELDISKIPMKKRLKYIKIGKFPSIRRDIAIIVDDKLPAEEIVKSIKETAKELLNNLELFDVYQGEGIDLGKKSLALGLTFIRSSSTLTDEEVDIVVNNVLGTLHNQFGAILRE